jgi:hypothetical protein
VAFLVQQDVLQLDVAIYHTVLRHKSSSIRR